MQNSFIRLMLQVPVRLPKVASRVSMKHSAHNNMIKHAVVLYHARYAREVITDILLKIK